MEETSPSRHLWSLMDLREDTRRVSACRKSTTPGRLLNTGKRRACLCGRWAESDGRSSQRHVPTPLSRGQSPRLPPIGAYPLVPPLRRPPGNRVPVSARPPSTHRDPSRPRRPAKEAATRPFSSAWAMPTLTGQTTFRPRRAESTPASARPPITGTAEPVATHRLR